VGSVTALFVTFVVVSAATDYLAATGFGVCRSHHAGGVGFRRSRPRLKVEENTLWVLGQTAMACLVTLGVEIAFARPDILE